MNCSENLKTTRHARACIGAGALALTLALTVSTGTAIASSNSQPADTSSQAMTAQVASVTLGSAGKQFPVGSRASVYVALMNASNTSKQSMAGGCFVDKATLKVEADGTAKLTVSLQGASIMGSTAYASGIEVYQSASASGNTVTATVDETQFVTVDGAVTRVPKTATFTIPSAATNLDGVYIKLPNTGMPNYAPDAFLSIDYANAVIANADGNDNPAPAAAKKVAMHRLYNPNSGEHFYTASDKERDELVAVGWNSEGEGWYAPEESGTPVYRMYNPVAGEHHYTMDASERDGLVQAGWNYESIGWYSDDGKAVPLYRDYNPNAFANNHNYTADASEHEALVAAGWRAEGLAWYGVAGD